MVEVSDKFRQLATDNGRHVYCRIEAGDEVFLDDRLINFTFDDVTHPDWFTVGTACANRFHFMARTDAEILSGAVVKPYISFDNEEWCPLGTFYVSRRYVRGNTLSVTAYDRMYTLDVPFSTELSLPCTSAALLEELCAANGLELPDSGYPYKITAFPQDCTVRDVIGFIAGLNRACAKFDRSGRLLLKKCNENTQHISYLNCMDIRRNMGQSKVSCLIAQTDSGELVSGEGAQTDTVEMYNPFMTQSILDDMYSMFKPFAFYGADIEMQGLPYLESGESIDLLDGKLLYRIVISEMELHYDGGLTGVIYSRNRTVADSPVYTDDLEAALKRVSAAAYRLSNDEQLAVSAEPLTVAEFAFDAQQGGFAQLDINVSMSESTADFAVFKVYVNGAEVNRSIAHNMEQDTGRHLVHISHLETALVQGLNSISVTAQTGNGDCYILAGAMQASLVVHGGSGGAAGSGTGAARLYDYAMLSDTSARCNGVTYDIEKDEATGLISKITDSLGNVLVPEADSSVTDTATHNAVFWAVAMARGIRSAGDTSRLVLFDGAAFADGYSIIDQRGAQAQYPATIANGALCLSHYYSDAHYNGGVVISPIHNSGYTKLTVEVSVSMVHSTWNLSRLLVAGAHDPDSGNAIDMGLSDMLIDSYYTCYDTSIAPNASLERTKYEYDISGTVGEDIYIAFQHNCNDFYIYSVILE